VAVGAHGFLEKPLCVDMAEADAMVAAVEGKDLKWAVAYNFRQTATLAHVRKCIVEDKLIGTVVEVRSRGKEDGRAGSEDMVVLGTHLFDLMRYLMGDALWCQADITHNGKPATPANIREASEPLGPMVGNRIHATFGFAKGTAGHFSSMFTPDASGGRWGLDIYGTKGVISIKMDTLSRKPEVKPTPEEVVNSIVPEVLWLDDSGWLPRSAADGTVISAWKGLPDAPVIAITDQKRDRHAPIVADLVAAIEEDRLPATSLQDSAKSLEMVQAVFEAYIHGGRIAIPLESREHPLKHWS
jgi:predicted dehydrogenase